MGWTAVISANVGIIALTAYFVMRQENRDDCKPTVVIKSAEQCLSAFDGNFCDGIFKAEDKKFLLPTWNMSLASCQADYGDNCVNGMLFYQVRPSAYAIYTPKKETTKKLEALYQKADNNYYYADGKLAPKETTAPNCAVQQATSRSGGGGSGGHWGGGGSSGSESTSRGGFGGSAHSSGS
jgi:hypothetical protein